MRLAFKEDEIVRAKISQRITNFLLKEFPVIFRKCRFLRKTSPQLIDTGTDDLEIFH